MPAAPGATDTAGNASLLPASRAAAPVLPQGGGRQGWKLRTPLLLWTHSGITLPCTWKASGRGIRHSQNLWAFTCPFAGSAQNTVTPAMNPGGSEGVKHGGGRTALGCCRRAEGLEERWGSLTCT